MIILLIHQKCKDSLPPYSQFLNGNRTDLPDFQKHISNTTKEFTEKGYPNKVIEKAKH